SSDLKGGAVEVGEGGQVQIVVILEGERVIERVEVEIVPGIAAGQAHIGGPVIVFHRAGVEKVVREAGLDVPEGNRIVLVIHLDGLGESDVEGGDRVSRGHVAAGEGDVQGKRGGAV